MERFIPREKLSKKKRAELDRQKRATWGFSPVSRRVESKKKYDRKRSRDRDDGLRECFFVPAQWPTEGELYAAYIAPGRPLRLQ